VEELARLGTVRRLAAGARLFHEGDRSRDVYLVRSGRLKVSTVSSGGKELLLVVREPGDLVGELSALDGSPRSATVTALEPVEVVVVSAERFVEHLARTPAAALTVLQTVTGRLREAERKRAEFGVHDATVRVARRLVEMSDRFGPRGLKLTQDELAGWIGASREAVARSLRQLREAGVVTTGRQVVDVVDLDALRDVAQSRGSIGAKVDP
jgi:CRP-like cAMP-binding protein